MCFLLSRQVVSSRKIFSKKLKIFICNTFILLEYITSIVSTLSIKVNAYDLAFLGKRCKVLDKNQQLMQTIGKAVAKYRQASGLTQAQLAEILGIGNDAVSRMERGTTVPTVLRLLELAEIFQCEIADLVTESSARSMDQARHLEHLLNQLEDSERMECLAIIEKLIDWKLSKG